MNVHVLYVLELIARSTKFRLSVCLSIRLSVHMNVRGFLAVGTITFDGDRGSKQNLVAVFYV